MVLYSATTEYISKTCATAGGGGGGILNRVQSILSIPQIELNLRYLSSCGSIVARMENQGGKITTVASVTFLLGTFFPVQADG